MKHLFITIKDKFPEYVLIQSSNYIVNRSFQSLYFKSVYNNTNLAISYLVFILVSNYAYTNRNIVISYLRVRAYCAVSAQLEKSYVSNSKDLTKWHLFNLYNLAIT